MRIFAAELSCHTKLTVDRTCLSYTFSRTSDLESNAGNLRVAIADPRTGSGGGIRQYFSSKLT